MASSPDLLTLAEAAARLGVHPTTLRRWADQGDVLVMVTPGGHRRFPVAEVERLRGIDTRGADERAVARHLVERALATTRVHLPEQAGAGWVAGYDDRERSEKRESGRRLMGLLQTYLGGDAGGRAEALESARTLARAYARDAADHGLGLTDLLRAVTFFRDQTLEGVFAGGDPGVDADAARTALQRVNTFYNEVLLAGAPVFE
jgi:excisionase family DNA binding protein